MPRKTNKAGASRIVTRASNRKILPAIQPGSLENTKDGKTMFAHRLYKQLQTMCSTWAHDKIPPFSANTAPLDRWLQNQIDRESTGFLAGFIDQGSMIQSNLHYRMVGSRPLISRTLDILHNSEGGEGFRRLIKATALNYYCSNFGGAVYMNRSEPVQASYLSNVDKWYFTTPPVDSLYATDPTLFQNNNDFIFPFSYDGELWNRYDFFRIVSMPSTRLSTWGVGRCPLWRCVQMARIFSATYDYIFDTLSPDSSKGILTIKGLSTQEFLEAMSGSESVNEGDETFKDGMTLGTEMGDIIVLADREEEIVVRFVTMSRLPDGFFMDQFFRWALTGFSVNLGYQLDEFIGSSSNKLLGQSGAEAQLGQARSGSKGGAEFSSYLQNNLQANVIPPTVQFEFSARDIDNELQDIQLKQAKADLVIALFEATQLAIIKKGDESQDTLIETRAAGEHVIDRAEARRLLTELGVVSWLSEERNPDIVIDDSTFDLSTHRLRQYREEFRESKYIQRLAMKPVGEQVILYDNWIDRASGCQRENELVLWDDDRDLAKPSLWSGADITERQADNIGPNDFKRRATSSKKITLDLTLNSQHARDITRLIRRFLLRSVEYLQEGDLSLDGYQNIAALIPKKDSDSFVSKVYAICQAGRDSLLRGKKISDTNSAQIASNGLSFAQKRWTLLTGLLDEEVRRLIDVTIRAHDGDEVTLEVRTDILGNLDEFLKIRAGELGTEEVTEAYNAGRDIATDITGVGAEAKLSV